MNALILSNQPEAAASAPDAAARRPLWPLAVIALGFIGSAVWTYVLGYAVFSALARLLG